MSVPAANGDFRREQTQLETSYLKGVTPQEQSGFGRDAQDWERLRRGVVGPIHKAGTFLDIGCANGLLMESVDAWSREDGPGVEVFGLDISAPDAFRGGSQRWLSSDTRRGPRRAALGAPAAGPGAGTATGAQVQKP